MTTAPAAKFAIGPYEILRHLGSGGMGEVYLADGSSLIYINTVERRGSLYRVPIDLPQLAEMSATKVSLVSYVVSAKYRASDDFDKRKMGESVAATFESLKDGEARERIGTILDRLR